MDKLPPDEPNRLSQINTWWSVVHRAHGSQTVAAQQAKHKLLERYGAAVRRYLAGALRDEAAADEVYQTFAVQFLEGKLAAADPQRGHFRSFLKTILYRSVADYYRRGKRDRLVQMDHDESVPAAEEEPTDAEFDDAWREALLARTWDALRQMERETGRPLFTVLRIRVESPQASSTELAEEISTHVGRTITATHFRVWLHRAREKFAALLLGEIRESLDGTDRDTLEQELADLNLLDYYRGALEQDS